MSEKLIDCPIVSKEDPDWDQNGVFKKDLATFSWR